MDSLHFELWPFYKHSCNHHSSLSNVYFLIRQNHQKPHRCLTLHIYIFIRFAIQVMVHGQHIEAKSAVANVSNVLKQWGWKKDWLEEAFSSLFSTWICLSPSAAKTTNTATHSRDRECVFVCVYNHKCVKLVHVHMYYSVLFVCILKRMHHFQQICDCSLGR